MERLKAFADIARLQKLAWKRIWNYNDMLVDSDDEDQMVIRLHIFHLYQTVSRNSIDYDVGIPARGWHGEGYRGHIFGMSCIFSLSSTCTIRNCRVPC